MKYKLIKIKKESNGVVWLTFDGPKMDFKPGQSLILKYEFKNDSGNETTTENKVVNRMYSFASSPTRENIELCVKKVEGGLVSCALQEIIPGTELGLKGPIGKFYFDEENDKDLVMIGCGCGIVPFLSILDYLNEKKLDIPVKIFISNKTQCDIIHKNSLETLSAENNKVKILFNLTREPEPVSCCNKMGRIDKGYLESNLDNVSGKTFFICGTDSFAESMKKILLEMNVKESQIKISAYG
ncbi:FAD-dependent oxidoreductase [archaeon]|jgi:ferredoxin-NADP reductase|nr:FAD-dependent oxidoreductase [archaeon]MBT3450348.1 FAD-dependent oxidoreductase [archaeon]MBT6868877.1 FAD-dependent oxidoreductase [archaeon]MBT7192902.1 FAD-dependent oxidoreductase [archaeon]MBT7380868.1 FAD-dependent oxidoreductase [archaeon]